MVAYQNKKGNSGITHYEIGKDFISVKYQGSTGTYVYRNGRVGKHHVDRMKVLAEQGCGLSTYISQHPVVREGYILAESLRPKAKGFVQR